MQFFSIFLLSAFLFTLIPVPSVSVVSAAQKVSPNELGMVPVLEYHKFGPVEDRWTRSYENFRKDLEWLYNNDYRAISIADYVQQKIRIPFGKKSVIFTFDDGTDSQVQLDLSGHIFPQTALGIMDKFLKTHPDFGSAAVFYVNQNFFPATLDRQKLLSYLFQTGREVQNHTATHADLSKLSFSEVDLEFAWFLPVFEKYGFKHDSFSIAYPFGGVPRADSFSVLSKYFKIGFLVGADPALMPYHTKFDAFKIPRIQAIDDEWKRWFRRVPGATARQQEVEVFTPFVSDGELHLLTVLDEKFLQKNAVRSDLIVKIHEVYPYEACEDPQAEYFLDYKRQNFWRRFSTAVDMTNFFDAAPTFLYKWWRREVLFPEPRGIYLTSNSAASQSGKNLAERLKEVGGNLIVFDVKETPGVLSYLSRYDGQDRKVQIPDLKKYIRDLQSQGFYVVARIVVFKDQYMTSVRPELAIQRAGGGVWRDDRGVPWLDPSHLEAQDYIIGLAKEIAEAGVDEVQYDYVRFPTEGDLVSARYKAVTDQKWHTIRDFLRRSRIALMPYRVALSADMFGIVGWNKGYDAQSTGQKIECLAPYLDVIYPMGYPSHFGPGFAGYANPADKPYDFVYKTTKFFVDFAKGTLTDIRPWLQAFTYRVTIPYNTDYIRQQIKAGRDAGGNGFALWNAANNYEVTWGAF